MNPILGWGLAAGTVYFLLSLFKKKKKTVSSNEDTYEPMVIEQPKTVSAPDFLSEKVTPEQWTTFIKSSRWGDKNTVTPSGLYGWFLFTKEDLRDYVGIDVVASPNAAIDFIANADAQYAAFVKMNQSYSSYLNEHPAFLNITFDGQKISLSGVLGLAHQLGMQGFVDWVSNGEVRTPETVEVLNQTNRIF